MRRRNGWSGTYFYDDAKNSPGIVLQEGWTHFSFRARAGPRSGPLELWVRFYDEGGDEFNEGAPANTPWHLGGTAPVNEVRSPPPPASAGLPP